jgi:hypothetical protein
VGFRPAFGRKSTRVARENTPSLIAADELSDRRRTKGHLKFIWQISRFEEFATRSSKLISKQFDRSTLMPETTVKPLRTRSPRDHPADIDGLNARIEQLQGELAKLEVEKRCSGVSAAGHRADFERERERCDTLMTEALMLAKVAMSAGRVLNLISCVG